MEAQKRDFRDEIAETKCDLGRKTDVTKDDSMLGARFLDCTIKILLMLLFLSVP